MERSYGPGELREEYRSTRDDLYPEGAAYDEVTRTFFVGSLAHGDVTRIGIDGEESIFYAGPDSPGRSTLGMAVDVKARRLWVCAIRDKESQAGLLWALDLQSGSLEREVELGTLQKGASCNDVTVDEAGATYVTDRQNPAIYRIPADGGPPVIWSNHPQLTPGTVGLNGIAITPDGTTLIVSHYKPARLLRIPMGDPSQVSPIELRGDAFSGGIHIASGADGIRFFKGQLYVAFDRWVMQVTSDDGWRTGTVHSARTPMKYGITAIAEAGGALYAANGQTAMYLLGLPPSRPFQLLRLDLSLFDD